MEIYITTVTMDKEKHSWAELIFAVAYVHSKLLYDTTLTAPNPSFFDSFQQMDCTIEVWVPMSTILQSVALPRSGKN